MFCVSPLRTVWCYTETCREFYRVCYIVLQYTVRVGGNTCVIIGMDNCEHEDCVASHFHYSVQVLPFLFRPLLPTYCRCRRLLHLITHNSTHTLGRTPLDEGSARRTDVYLTTHNTHNIYTSTPPEGFELATPPSERPQTLRPRSDRQQP